VKRNIQLQIWTNECFVSLISNFQYFGSKKHKYLEKSGGSSNLKFIYFILRRVVNVFRFCPFFRT